MLVRYSKPFYQYIILAEPFVIMPNHIHGVVIIEEQYPVFVGARHVVPKEKELSPSSFGKPMRGSIPTIIASFKSTVTRKIRKISGSTDLTLWQRNYFEHIIRDEKDYLRIVEYIQNNPLQWEVDKYYNQ